MCQYRKGICINNQSVEPRRFIRNNRTVIRKEIKRVCGIEVTNDRDTEHWVFKNPKVYHFARILGME